jgi:subtilisin family serine protease
VRASVERALSLVLVPLLLLAAPAPGHAARVPRNQQGAPAMIRTESGARTRVYVRTVCLRLKDACFWHQAARALPMLLALTGVSHAAELTQEPGPPQHAAVHAKGRVLVRPRAGLPEEELDRVLKPHGGRRVAVIEQIGVHVVELPEQADEAAVARMLEKNPPTLVPNDTLYPKEWHHPKIATPTAWNATRGLGVTIAILDSGVDAAHPDLAGAMVPGWNVYDSNSDTRDVYGHGTKVAGAAAAIGNNSGGVAGVAYQARIMPMRVTDLSGWAWASTLSQGLAWAADRGARVANMSFQGVCSSSTVLSAAQYFRNKGGVAVAAAGNTGALLSGSQNSALICVTATTSSDARASWSSYGAFVDVAAPGVGIYSTTRGGSYASVSGTSFASPIVAGVYALMKAANGSLAPSTLDKALTSTARDLGSAGWDQYYGWGRVDAAAAVAKAQQTSASDTQNPAVSITSPTGGKVTGVVPVDVKATDNVGVARVELYARGSLVASDTLVPYRFSWDTRRLAKGSARLEARAYDAAGNTAASAPVSVTIK